VLHETEGIDVEPSATAGLTIPWRMGDAAAESPAGVHLVWLTGGAMVPEGERAAYVEEGRGLVERIGDTSAIFVD
jgi:D-serine dehydratase